MKKQYNQRKIDNKVECVSKGCIKLAAGGMKWCTIACYLEHTENPRYCEHDSCNVGCPPGRGLLCPKHRHESNKRKKEATASTETSTNESEDRTAKSPRIEDSEEDDDLEYGPYM